MLKYRETIFAKKDVHERRNRKEKMKKFKLIWNKWSKEWKGHAHFNELEKALEGTEAKIEKEESALLPE